MSGVTVFTSLTRETIAAACVMARTLRLVHPEWSLRAVLVDAMPAEDAGLLGCFDGVTEVTALGIPGVLGWLFGHTRAEACAAVKGAMLGRLLDEGAGAVVFLAPEVAVFNPLAPVVEALEVGSIVFAPHRLRPSVTGAGILAREVDALLHGTFDLGFTAVRNDVNGRAFAAWWAEQLGRACHDDVERGIWRDQKYCDLVPGLFEGVRVLRDPGCNVSVANVDERALAFAGDGVLMAGDRPVRFCRIDDDAAAFDAVSGASLAACEVWAWHRRQVAAMPVGGGWHYGHFSDGTPIKPKARVLFRSRPDLIAGFDNPFQSGPGSFQGWLRRERPDLL